jgi:hypothetical protein
MSDRCFSCDYIADDCEEDFDVDYGYIRICGECRRKYAEQH